MSGFDTLEISWHAECPAENHLGFQAANRMSALLQTPGLMIEDSGEVDRFARAPVWLRLRHGCTVGSMLIAERLAVEWTPDYFADWCSP